MNLAFLDSSIKWEKNREKQRHFDNRFTNDQASEITNPSFTSKTQQLSANINYARDAEHYEAVT